MNLAIALACALVRGAWSDSLGAVSGMGLPKIGDVLVSRYRIVRVLAEGGMGVVYEAEHVRLAQRVAIKILRPGGDARAQGQARFEREAKLSSKLKSPHVIRVFDVECTPEGLWFMAMELLDGRDLAREIVSRGTLEVPVALEIVRQVCVGLAEAHKHGIVHRDLKPSNVFLLPNEATPGVPMAKILDFGISKVLEDEVSLTQTQVGIGTPLYMSPEQIRSAKHVDERTDIWSIGVMLYEMLAGAPPFAGATATAVAAAVVVDAVPSLRSIRGDVSPALEDVITRALAKNPAERIPSVEALRAALAPLARARSGADLSQLFEDDTTVARVRPPIPRELVLPKRGALPPQPTSAPGLSSDASRTSTARTDAGWSGAPSLPPKDGTSRRTLAALAALAATASIVLVILVLRLASRGDGDVASSSSEGTSMVPSANSAPVVRSAPPVHPLAAPDTEPTPPAPIGFSALPSAPTAGPALAPPVSPRPPARVPSNPARTCTPRDKIMVRGRMVCP